MDHSQRLVGIVQQPVSKGDNQGLAVSLAAEDRGRSARGPDKPQQAQGGVDSRAIDRCRQTGHLAGHSPAELHPLHRQGTGHRLVRFPEQAGHASGNGGARVPHRLAPGAPGVEGQGHIQFPEHARAPVEIRDHRIDLGQIDTGFERLDPARAEIDATDQSINEAGHLRLAEEAVATGQR